MMAAGGILVPTGILLGVWIIEHDQIGLWICLVGWILTAAAWTIWQSRPAGEQGVPAWEIASAIVVSVWLLVLAGIEWFICRPST